MAEGETTDRNPQRRFLTEEMEIICCNQSQKLIFVVSCGKIIVPNEINILWKINAFLLKAKNGT